jgi:hypothetical protein
LFPGAGLGMLGGGVLCLVGAGMAVVLVVGAFLFWLYRLGTDEDEVSETEEIWESPDQDDWESGDQATNQSGTTDDSPAL